MQLQEMEPDKKELFMEYPIWDDKIEGIIWG